MIETIAKKPIFTETENVDGIALQNWNQLKTIYTYKFIREWAEHYVIDHIEQALFFLILFSMRKIPAGRRIICIEIVSKYRFSWKIDYLFMFKRKCSLSEFSCSIIDYANGCRWCECESHKYSCLPCFSKPSDSSSTYPCICRTSWIDRVEVKSSIKLE